MASPILTVAQMRAWEQATWQSGQTEQAVIARVGRLVAERALALTETGDRVLVLTGKGHNGDDGRLAAPHLKERRVELLEVVDPARQLPELVSALERSPRLIIDGLFGIGLSRRLSQDWVAFIERINEARCRVLAIDVPSGLDGESGETAGAAVRATVTFAVGAVKRGLIKTSAVPFVGRVELAADIGLCACPVESELHWIEPADFSRFPPDRRMDAHKGDFGHLVIIAGSLGYHGAAVLAARGAQAAQPGLITVITTEDTYVPVASQLQSAMVRPWTPGFELPAKATAVLFGPGMANDNVPTGLRDQAVNWWREFPGVVVVDASGLDWISRGESKLPGIRVITPHPGEAARLLQAETGVVQSDRVASVRELSRKLGGSWVVLKGHHSLIGAASGPVFVNATGGPRLAQGGSGDVLAGYLAGLLAQPTSQAELPLAVCFAVWRHGLAGESKDWNGLIEELPRALATAVPVPDNSVAWSTHSES